MVEEKVYYKHEGEQSKAGTSRRVQSEHDPEPGHVRRGKRRERRDRRPGDQKARRVKGRQKAWVTIWMIGKGSYTMKQVWTEGCWENLAARFTLI